MIDLALVLALNLFADEPKKAEPAQDPERPALSIAELKALRENNIFAPRSARRTTPKTSKSERPGRFETTAPAKPKPPLVTGIFFDAKAEAFLVVVEDRNSESMRQFKEPKFLKSGDEVSGFKVGAVTAETAVFVHGETSKELRVGDSLPADDKVSAAPAENGEAAPAPSPSAEAPPSSSESYEETFRKMREKVGKKNRPSRDE